ncbi:Transposon Ty3-I Gag-Pol polyprotein [Labeo rohita]|uniref:ribonuclease H n=1 Tax=Labeo rohita TaxID=84645 RepID=A0ABQ8L8F1_LABRO|nr:Transposon Ty3-I Gag-Pol polyprotein [Labeo rohita]
MDPAKETPIRSSVELQGAMLGRHQEELSAARYAVEGLSAQVTELTNQLQSLRSEPTVIPSRFYSEPRINNPPCYSGQPTQCRAFLTQCEVVFSLQPATYAADRWQAKVAFVISLLSGRACDWGAAVWEMEAVFCEHFSLFKEEMIKVFDHSVFGQEASRLLSSLRQGKRSAADYAIEFRTLAATCEWNEPALAARFLEGLTEEVREEILSRDVPSSLDQMVELAIRLDKRFEGRRRARVPVPTLQPISTSSSSAAPRTDPEPKQLGSLCISGAERQRRIHHRLCLYCGAEGHFAIQCPVKDRARSTRSCSAFIDSGAEGNFIDEDWALQHGVPLQELVDPLPVFALDGSVLSKILRVTIPEELDDLSGVPREYHDLRAVFSRSRAASLPPHRPYHCSIDLIPGSTPSRGKLYSLSNPEREALKKYLSESLAAGTIVPSSSPAGAGFFFVAKKDGSLRPCIDYRGLNDITIKNRYPLPLMSSAFEILQGAKIFTKLDLRNAYHLVRIKEGDEWKTAFNTPLGHFEYRVLPFGLANAPSVFQALVNDVLRDMLNIFVFVYLDDILIFSPSVSDHVQHVRRVLQRLLENCLFVKAEKCVFHVKSVTFLGVTLTSVRQRFWWPAIVRDVRRYVASCPVCAQSKSSNSPPAGLLRPLPIPSHPWSHIALDFVSGLPSSAGNTVILTIIDRFSKAAHFIPLPKLPSAKETALTVFDHVFKIHGLPSDIVSDRGPQFISQFWREFCRQIGATVSLSSGFHPQTNGQAERVNQILGRLLRTLAAHNPASWCENLRWAEYAYNSLPSSATGLSPFHACLGYQPPVFSSQEVEASVPSVQALISRCRRTWSKKAHSPCRQPPPFPSPSLCLWTESLVVHS